MKNILISGAGPVGLTAALTLAKYGVSSTIFDCKSEWCPCGSRAIVLDRGSLEHFRELGCLESMLAQGLIAQSRTTFFKERKLYTNIFPQPCCDGIPFFLNLPQPNTERILLDLAEQSPMIKILWGHEVTSVDQNPERVRLTVNQTSNFDGAYVIAADGCRSPLRKMCGLDFPGQTNSSGFLIADVRVDFPFQCEHHFHFSHPCNKGRTTLFVPQPDNVWRIDWQLPKGVDFEREKMIENVSERVRHTIGKGYKFSLEWASCYQFHQRLMENMTFGRIAFAGDAAHLVNPFGARGMNSGIHDVMNLTWKIAQILHGNATPEYFATYDIERGFENSNNQTLTKRTMKFVAPETLVGHLTRNTILRMSPHSSWFRGLVDSGKMSTPPERNKGHIPHAYIPNKQEAVA